MAEEEIMIEDQAIALEDTEDSVVDDAQVNSMVDFVSEKYQRAEDYRNNDEERWLRAYRTIEVYMVLMFNLLKLKNLECLLKSLRLKH